MPHILEFSKMHGLGNDFVIIENLSQQFTQNPLPIAQWSNRHSGIGFDQLLVIQPSKKADAACRIFNADGSEAEQCGNGMRCVARFLYEKNLVPKKKILIETKKRLIETTLHDFKKIEVNMGEPQFNHVKNHKVISMGNPHVIFIVEDIKHFPAEQTAREISTHFPDGMNTGFMEIKNRNHILLRTIERGAGETYACGSNACAAVAAGIQQNKLDNQVMVSLTLGELEIHWQGGTTPMIMTGPAEHIYDGRIKL